MYVKIGEDTSAEKARELREWMRNSAAYHAQHKYVRLKMTLAEQIDRRSLKNLILTLNAPAHLEGQHATELFEWMEGQKMLSAENVSSLRHLFGRHEIGLGSLLPLVDAYVRG